MKKIIPYLPFFGALLSIGIIFHSWFTLKLISAGDLVYMSPATMKDQTILPFAWMNNQSNGLGGYAVPFLDSQYNETLFHFFSSLGWSWPAVERITQLFPFLIVLFLASFCLSKLFSKNFSLLTFLIFSLNTYMLMVVGGGQIVVAISYACIPIAFYFFYRAVEQAQEIGTQALILKSLIFGLILSIEVMLDLRFAYILVILCSLYYIFAICVTRKKLLLFKNLFSICVISFGITVLLNAFWVLPFLLVRENPFQSLGNAYNSLSAVHYLSFATFENALGLLHPQWPENIFGKTYFMRPEFLLMPLIAFSSLLFIHKSKDRATKRANYLILFFLLIGLIGIFLAKGANDPFGNIYLWLFDHIPGFMLFRDSTKWYVLVAISYAVLIPFSVMGVSEFLKKKFTLRLQIQMLKNIISIFVCCYLLFLIRPAISGELQGTFQSSFVPQEYSKLTSFLSSEKEFSRILWVPGWERYGYYSFDHPAISAANFYSATSLTQLLNRLSSAKSENLLQKYNVHYVIIPYDSKGELFQTDRKYDAQKYENTVKTLQHILWLHEVQGFGRNHVFVLNNAKNLFWTSQANTSLSYKTVDMTDYIVQIKNAQKGELLIFTQSYDKHWSMHVRSQKITSQPFENLFNSFVLPKSGNYQFVISYDPQKWIYTGLWIGFTTIIIILGYLIWYSFAKK